MARTKKAEAKDTKASRTKKKEKDCLQNIITLRISDRQKIALEKLSKATSKSISDIMREAVSIWSDKRRKLCLE